jgi:acyl-CoA synthetase (AMP-forming)/AMP-acid ligase II
MLVHQFLEASAEKYPDSEALVHLKTRINYIDLEKDSNRLANQLLDCGVKTGDRVGILYETSINYVISFFAVLKAGGVAVPLNTATTPRIISGILANCTPTALIAQKEHVHFLEEISGNLDGLKNVIVNGRKGDFIKNPSISSHDLDEIRKSGNSQRPRVEINDEDLAAIIYTSGTTSDPKGVMLTHKNLAANTDSIVEYLELTQADKVMAILPFFYSYGNSLLLTHVRVGGSIVIDNRFAYPNVILDIMSKERVTGFSGVPSTFAILMHKSNILNYNWEHLRYLTQAGGPMTPALTMKIMEAIPHIKIFIMYGQTEASARLSYLKPDKLLDKIGSIGKAIPGVTLMVKDDKGKVCAPGITGEIVATGDNIMKGYWNQPGATSEVLKEDGLHTGDLARTDEENYLYIVSRMSDMIKSGAHRISPKEIEEIIAEQDDVVESAVVGMPDEILGEAITAVIVLKNKSKITEREIMRHCRANLPAFKIPKKIVFRESIPKTASGKIRRHLLVKELTEIL